MIDNEKIFGFGGQIGNGNQGFPWIALDDLLSALNFIICKKQIGVFNLTAPEQINNKQLTMHISKIWHRPSYIKLPSYIIRLFWGQMGEELLLNGNQAIPTNLLKSNFIFKYTNIIDCLRAIKQKTC